MSLLFCFCIPLNDCFIYPLKVEELFGHFCDSKSIFVCLSERRNNCIIKACFHWDSWVDSQASRRTKCCESVITLINVITLITLVNEITNYFFNHFSQCNYSTQRRTLWVDNPSEIGGRIYVQITAFREWRLLWVDSWVPVETGL